MTDGGPNITDADFRRMVDAIWDMVGDQLEQLTDGRAVTRATRKGLEAALMQIQTSFPLTEDVAQRIVQRMLDRIADMHTT